MWLKKKKSNNGRGSDLHAGGVHLKEQTAGWIANGIISVQMKLARILSSWEKRCNQAQRKIALVLFCGIVSCYLFFSLNDVLSEKPVKPKVADPAIDRLSLPPVLPKVLPNKNGDTSISPVDHGVPEQVNDF